MGGQLPAGIAVRGLFELWESWTGRGPRSAALPMADRILLDVLHLGIEQTATYLGQVRPEFATFKAWILDTAGPPDRDRVARYHAWLEGSPAPAPVHHALQSVEDAPAVLAPADFACWDEHGYVILRAAIGRHEAAAAAALLWQQVKGDPENPDSWYDRRANGIMVQFFQHPALEAARRSPRVHKAFAQLWGTADLWMTTDRMSFNPPERPGWQWPGPDLHWDVSLAPPIPFATQGILYLTDTAADQGALQLVPGFHHRLAGWLDEIGDADPRRVDLSAEAVTVPAGAGDLVIWRQELPHGASRNTGTRPRMAQYVNMYSPLLTEHAVFR